MMTTRNSKGGFTLVELLVVVNIIAILVGVASILSSEYGGETRCLEVCKVLPQIIRSQALYYMQHNEYYAADQNDLKRHGVDLSEVRYFTYSTAPNVSSLYSVRAEATEWAAGGWIVYDHRGNPCWGCDGLSIKRAWLPE